MSSSSIASFANAHIYLYRYAGIPLYVVGNLTNILTIFIFLKKSWRKNVCVFYFLVCLFSNTVHINAVLLGSIFLNGFNINLLNSSVVLCKLYYYLVYVFSFYFPTVLILASVDRLLISSQNVDTRLYSSKRLAYLAIGICTFAWNIFSCHALIKMNVQQFSPTISVCTVDPSNFYIDFISYSTLVIAVLLFVLMAILSILAFKNVRRIRAIPRQQRQQIRSMTKKDFQLLRCLYAHNIVYIIFSSSLLVSLNYSSALRHQTPTPFEQSISTFISGIASFLQVIPYGTSFFIFVSMSRAFRNELKRLVAGICGKDIRTIRDDEPTQQEEAKNQLEANNMAISTIILPA